MYIRTFPPVLLFYLGPLIGLNGGMLSALIVLTLSRLNISTQKGS